MGRAIVRQPQAFLFDEPLSNLDAKLRAQTRLEIRKLHAELGVTSLFVTHDQVEAMTMAQRMIVMNAGRMEQIGTPDEVYQRPATAFVASFIGSPPMNLLDGTADGAQLHALPVRPCRCLRRRRASGALIVGLRPEHARLAAPDQPGWPFEVGLVEMLGAERLVHGSVAGAEFTVRMDAMLAEPATRRSDAAAVRCRAAALVRRRNPGADRMTDPRAADWPLPFWIAHRGAGKLAPENTLAAFRVGAAHGYRAFECDVKLSRRSHSDAAARR